jgi:hypothetical protein
MAENNPSNVFSAFEILLEEIEAEIDFFTGVGSQALQGRDYNKAKELIDHAQAITNFRNQVSGLRKEWTKINAAAEEKEDEETRIQRNNLGKLRKGLRTPESSYVLPILQALDQMGGSGKVSEVLDKVGEIMRPILKNIDYDPLASNPDNPRWRNTAQWARNSMVNEEGFLKKDSPRGIWEISEKGRAFLKEQ